VPAPLGLLWKAKHPGAGLEVGDDAATRTDEAAGADFQMPGDTGLGQEEGAGTDLGAAGDAGLGHQRRAGSELDVVGNDAEVVDLHAPANARTAEPRAVDGAVRPDLDVVLEHHVAQLGDLLQPAVLVELVAESVAANHHPGLEDHPVPEVTALPHDHAGVQDALCTDDGIVVDHRTGV
jgi:hypothetical protein